MIVEALPDGVPSIVEIATRLDTSERTLRRRLADEKTSFDELRENLPARTRRGVARRHVRKCAIALAVGSQASAFSRAFKRWTGKTPSEARAAKTSTQALDPRVRSRLFR